MGFGSDKTGFYKPSAVTVTASGNPLTLQNAKRLRKLTIYGNAVQDGTPTPDTPVDIQLCGDATGNLLSSEWEQGDINSSTGINEASSIRIRTIDHIKCEPNTAYAFYSPYYTSGVRYYNDDKEYMHYDFVTNSTLLNFTTPESTKYLRFIVENSPAPDVTLPYMLLKGSYTAETLPAYEPYGYKVSGRAEGDGQPPQDFAVYLPEQIAKVGDVADEVVVDMEKQTAELRKNVGSVVADGDESWFRGNNQYDTADYTNRFSNFYDIRGNSETPGYFSNRFERKLGGIWNNPNSEAFNINNNQLHLSISNTRLGITADDEATDRTTKFKAWLNDNNVTVYAPLATPVTTDITSLQQWDAMPQVSGTVTLTLSAEVDPSGAEAVYTATKRPKAQAALIEENTITEEPAETQVSDADINTEIIMMED